LEGKVWVGTGCRWSEKERKHVTRYVIIDLDARTAGDDLWAHYARVVHALGLPTLLFRSSGSGGLHLYYLLSKETNLWSLRGPDGQTGALVRVLAHAGLRERKGELEIYPGGCYQDRGPTGRIRLPFGYGSALLDPKSRNPITGAQPTHDLRWVSDALNRGALTIYNPDLWLAQADALPPTDSEPSVSRSKSSEHVSQTSREIVCANSLWQDGLSGARQFNQAVSALAFDLRRAGVTLDDAISKIQSWMHEHHNDKSRTYNASQIAAEREISSIVKRVYAWGATGTTWAQLPGLSGWEAARLRETIFPEESRVDPTTGEILPLDVVQRFAFELVRRAKQWVLTRAQAHLKRTSAARGEISGPGPVRRDELLRILKRLCGQGVLEGRFVVPMPRDSRRRISVVKKMEREAIWRALKRVGIPRPVKGHCRDTRRAATFEVKLDFGAFSDDDREFHAPTEVAPALSDPSDLARCSGDGYAHAPAYGSHEATAGTVPSEAQLARAIASLIRQASSNGQVVPRDRQ
jgi:hypothetical protein